ncbi:hypothetical protein niasHS_008050 [Heterodera schachtii]|uniref:Uncharacterized protein n=1 Tax=Heterodera schachtii TaxID=97005 RepID=A0ABD2JC41_HETSC
MVPVQPEQQRPTEAVQKTAKMDKKTSAAQLKREAKRAAVLQHAGRAFPWRCYAAMYQPKKQSWHSDGFVPWLDYLKAKWLLQRQARTTAFNERAVEAADDAQAADAVSNDVRTGTSAGGGAVVHLSTATAAALALARRESTWHILQIAESRVAGKFTLFALVDGALRKVSLNVPRTIYADDIEPSVKLPRAGRFDLLDLYSFFAATAENGNAAGGASARGSQAAAVTRLSATFACLYALSSDQLDQEHALAWKELNLATFHISQSKAPNALNQPQIDTVRDALLSTVRATLLENGTGTTQMMMMMMAPMTTKTANQQQREIALRWAFVVRLFAQCYAGHSTLLTPSKLWQRWDDLRTALKTLDIWRMTLEHRGCARLMRGPTGAHGVVQAFLLSLSAATFTTASSPPAAAATVGALYTLQQQQNNSPQ